MALCIIYCKSWFYESLFKETMVKNAERSTWHNFKMKTTQS